jgi:putative nucleotidyltransferase with HDIG domain
MSHSTSLTLSRADRFAGPSVGVTAAETSAPKRILFVDDDQALLDGLRDALRPHRRRWAMSFVTNGEAALARLEAEPHDVVISDLRMPGMDGASLLELVRDRCPAAVRIVLSGQAEVRIVARAAAEAHRLIAKPCDTQDLARVIERSCALQEIAARAELDPRAMGVSALPSVPRVHAELTELLAPGGAGAADAARIIEQDIAMAAKVLQLANSAYFGRRSPVSRVSEAVACVGLDTLRAYVLHVAAFQESRILSPIPGFDLDELHRHSTRVARLAAALAAETGAGDDALTAGLLHDVGLLVMASQDPEGLASVLARAREQGRPVHQIEREEHGMTHAELGAYLLALWGLPDTVTEAVAGVQDGRSLKLPFDTVAATQVANALVAEIEAQHLPSASPPSDIDLDHLERAGLGAQLSHWRDLAARQFEDAG